MLEDSHAVDYACVLCKCPQISRVNSDVSRGDTEGDGGEGKKDANKEEEGPSSQSHEVPGVDGSTPAPGDTKESTVWPPPSQGNK